MDLTEKQLSELRDRLKQIRNAKHWLQEYRVNAPSSISSALGIYYSWLETQEAKTITMGKRLKDDPGKR